jgi:hypothetical protein
MVSSNRTHESRIILSLTFILLVLASYQVATQANEMGVLFVSRRWTGILVFLLVGAVTALSIFVVSWTKIWYRLDRAIQVWIQQLAKIRWGNILLGGLTIAFYCWLVLGPLGYLFETNIVRLTFFWLVVLAGSIFIIAFSISSRDLGGISEYFSWFWAVLASWILAGFVYQLAVMLQQVSTYPFSLGWSETSRYYYASIFFDKQIYGIELTPSVLHPTRYMMQAIPFIVSGLPLWFHRFWQVFIWVLTANLSVYLLSKRLSLTSKWSKISLILFMAWAYLFLFQGPVYYHLLVCVIIVLWGFDRDKFWKSLIVIVLASAWAGISRINWYPMPGLLAATIYFLETGFPQPNRDKNAHSLLMEVATYLLKPLGWVLIGTLIAIGTQMLYVIWSGAEPGEFTSSFTSDLLWYRLFPNPTFPLGILPAILLISAPLLILIIKGLRRLNPLRLVGIGSILFVLLVGGVIVSTKIGGGSNLHNLDAYLVILLVIGGYVYFGNVESETSREYITKKVYRVLLVLIVFIPVVYALSFGGSLSLPERQIVEQTLETLRDITSSAVNQGGDILFITERHLLTFGILQGITLIENYETVFLMEMAMAGNQDYLSGFHQNLQEQNYALIITDQQRINYKGREYAFGEENDVWVSNVTVPLLKYYQREMLFKGFGIEVLVPKE